MPARLGAHYIDDHSQKRTPVMLHRAILGSLERFFAILIEHHAGRLPTWLAPVQVVVMNITDRQAQYVGSVTEKLRKQGFRVASDLRNEKVGFKIREHTLQRVPYLLVAGDKEVAADLVAVRTRSGKDLGTMSAERSWNVSGSSWKAVGAELGRINASLVQHRSASGAMRRSPRPSCE